MPHLDKKSAHIVVVGAGISGLSAAVSLLQKGFINITILEARNRVGGRIHSIKTDDFTFEAGAQWVQKGLEKTFENVSSKIKLCGYSMNVLCFHEEYKQLLNVDLDLVKLTNDKFNEIFDDADATEASMAYNDLLSYTSANWSEYFKNSKLANDSLLEELYLNYCCTYRSFDGCNSLADLAAYSGYKKVGDEELLVHGSYSTLPQTLAGFLPADCLKYRHVVEKIQWHQTESRNQVVKVICSDEKGRAQEFLADHVLVTLPLGVLKRHHTDLFEPSLPEQKVDAINRLSFGLTNKIILHYEKPFWKEGAYEILFIWKDQDRNNRPWWKTIVTTYILPDVANEKYYLVIFLSGEEALQVEKEDPIDVGRICSEIFHKFLCLEEVPVPKFTYVTKWSSDPFSCGSYSNIPVGSSNKYCDVLAKPLLSESEDLPRILFAGEATHSEYFSTVHGGFFSGRREAERLHSFYS